MRLKEKKQEKPWGRRIREFCKKNRRIERNITYMLFIVESAKGEVRYGKDS